MQFSTSMKTISVNSSDGTRIQAYEFNGSGPVIVLCPGLGTPAISWKRVVDEFSDRFHFYTWDTRGCYGSETPKNLDNLGIADHTGDMEAVVKAFGLKRFTIAGWSMGVGIALEYIHRHPGEVNGLILINGTFRKALSTAFSILPGAETILTALIKIARDTAPFSGPILRWILSKPWAIDVLRTMGIVTAGEEFFKAVVAEFTTMRWAVYFQMMLKYNEHDASPYLADIRVPTLITAGTKDALTPVSMARFMARQIRGAQLSVIEKGTHYAILEYPEQINQLFLNFLRRLYLDPDQVRLI